MLTCAQVASGFNPATILGILCVYKYEDPRFDHDYLLNLLRSYIRAEKNTVRRDETLENELRVLDMMVDKAVFNHRQEVRRRILQAVAPPLPLCPPDVYRVDWPSMQYDEKWDMPTVDTFVVPPEWDGTAPPMPESSDMAGWFNILQYVSGVGDIPANGSSVVLGRI